MLPASPVVDICDLGHQAVAFVGSCPICARSTHVMAPPLREGSGTFRGELDRVLAEHYAQREALG